MTQAFDVDKVLNDEYLLRFSNSVRMSEETEGVRWRSPPGACTRRSTTGARCVTRPTCAAKPTARSLTCMACAVTHRRSAWRDWLFLEFGAQLFWADGPEPADRCDACVGAAIGFEVLFGDAYDRSSGATRAACRPRRPGQSRPRD